MRLTFALLALCAVSCKSFGQKDAPLPADLQLDFFQAQAALQQAQEPYQKALAAIVDFCKAQHDQVPIQDPANPKRLKCSAKPPEKKAEAKK